MSTQEHERIINAYFQAMDEERLDDLMDLLAADAVWAAPLRKPTRDRAAIRSFYADLLAWQRRHNYSRREGPTNIIHGENEAAVEIDFVITGADGKIVVAGQGVDIFKFREGKVINLTLFFDSATMLKATGQLAAFAKMA